MGQRYIINIMLTAERQLGHFYNERDVYDETNIYHHIIISCKNRLKVLRDPKAALYTHRMSRGRYVKLVNKLKEQKDEDSQVLYRFARQGINNK